MNFTKCAMTGCGKQPTHTVVLSIPGGIAEGGNELSKGPLEDAATFPACQDHVDHITKIFYGAAHALSGTVTASSGTEASSGLAGATTAYGADPSGAGSTNTF